MYRLAYVSRAADHLGPDEIGQILDTSVSNNYERFVTGFLAHAHGQFMQVLEGPEGEVRELYERICGDDRHSCIMQLLGERIEQRAFPDWSMNYHRVDDRSGSSAMVMRRDEPADRLMPATTPRDLLFLFSKFITRV
jgi:hypothetical protein